MGLRRAELTKILREWSLGSLIIKEASLPLQKFLTLSFSQGCTQTMTESSLKFWGSYQKNLSFEQVPTNSQQHGVYC